MNASLNEKLRAVKWGEYKLGTLFDIENTLSFNVDKLVDGIEYDYVTRTSINQGVLQTTGFVNESNINASGTWSLGLLSMDFFYRRKPWYAGQFVRKIIPNVSIPERTVPFFSTILNKQKPKLLSVLVRSVDETFKNMFGSAKYRNYRYGADDHVAVVHTEKLSMDASIFVTGAIHKAAHTGKFNYGHNFYAKDADALDIMLPVKNGVPDYISMSTLISAIRKLVIKDVVLYTNRKVSAAKKITKKKES